MNNVTEKNSRPCSGCGACMAVCPREAVTLSLNAAGFYEAAVKEALCADCGLCRRVCARFGEAADGVRLYDAPLFALQSGDASTVQRCSSGGIAHELAALALREGQTAVGAAYDTDTDRVRHIAVSDTEGLSALDGSKYLQSDPAVFRTVLAEAKAEPSARFAVFGTPCQIAGLARAAELNGVREQFLLTEIFCHGVPSYRVWEAECDRIRQKLGAGKFDEVRFRCKKDDWHSYCLRVRSGGRSFEGGREELPFYRIYFEDVLLNDACLSCPARKETSPADLRLGDYWGPRFARRRDGVSAVYALTERGRAAVEKLNAVSFAGGTAAEQLRFQNMAGYDGKALHDGAMAVLSQQGLKAAVRYYRKRLPLRQRVKGALLTVSALLPARWRAAWKRHRTR